MNRSQADINKNVDMIVARRKEREYFETSPEYGHLAHKMGSEYLAKLLSQVFSLVFFFIGIFISIFYFIPVIFSSNFTMLLNLLLLNGFLIHSMITVFLSFL